jgi:hypothetical protein
MRRRPSRFPLAGSHTPARPRRAGNQDGVSLRTGGEFTRTLRLKAHVLDRLENNVAVLGSADSVSDELGAKTRVLIDMTFALEGLAGGMFAEIVDRNALGRRWLHACSEFMPLQFKGYGMAYWPFAA